MTDCFSSGPAPSTRRTYPVGRLPSKASGPRFSSCRAPSIPQQYGSLYSNLLDYVISAALIFYVLTIAAVIRLRRKQPNASRPFRAPGYPVIPLVYIVGGTVVLLCLFAYRPASTWPGLLIVLLGLPIYWVTTKRSAA